MNNWVTNEKLAKVLLINTVLIIQVYNYSGKFKIKILIIPI